MQNHFYLHLICLYNNRCQTCQILSFSLLLILFLCVLCALCGSLKQNLVHKRNRIALAAVKNKKTRLFPANAEAKDDSG